MEARGKALLSIISVYMVAEDFRGKQSGILRLIPFDKEAFAHMLFYRILLVLGFFTGTICLFGLLYNNALLIKISEFFIVIDGILFTPQLYSIVKVLAISLTNGTASGDMNNSFIVSANISRTYFKIFKALEYFVVLAWFIILAVYFKVLI